MSFSEDLKKVVLAGVGAAAVTAEKGKEVVDTLVKKGELTVAQGKVMNEELKHKATEKREAAKKAAKDAEEQHIIDSIAAMSPEELEALKNKVAQANSKNDEADN